MKLNYLIEILGDKLVFNKIFIVDIALPFLKQDTVLKTGINVVMK